MSGHDPHFAACNYWTKPIGSPGCICLVVPKYLYQQMEARLLAAEELAQFVEHYKDCLCAQQRAGEPTEDGRYRRLYGYDKEELWCYGDDLPPCSCGLTEALEKWEKLNSV